MKGFIRTLLTGLAEANWYFIHCVTGAFDCHLVPLLSSNAFAASFPVCSVEAVTVPPVQRSFEYAIVL
jgi:hypothetical protein